MKYKFIDILNKYSKVSKDQESILTEHLVERKITRQTEINRPGEICREIYFIVEGIVRFFVVDEEGNEQTALFMCKGEFCSDAISFYQREPAYGYLQAETDCQLICISHQKFDYFGKNIPGWYPFFNHTISVYFQRVLGFNRKLLHLDAKEAYLTLIEFYPDIENRVPLNHIASYLGITQFSLSRIRKELNAK